jgi:transposase
MGSILDRGGEEATHHNVLATALANKLARIAWAVLNKGRAFTCVKTDAMASRQA